MRPTVERSDPFEIRARFERFTTHSLPPPPLTLVLPCRLAPGLDGLVVANRPGTRPAPRDRVILWFHGGAFVAGSSRSHKAMLARLARATGLEAVLPDYRLAPEHPFPAAVEDARAAFDSLVARGLWPENIVIGGDSAGGNLALGLLAGLLAERVRPAGAVALSPATDLTFSGVSILSNEAVDTMLPANRRGDICRYYLAGADPADPRASPLKAAFPNPPPVFLQVSTTEILHDDSRRMARKLAAAGGRVVLDEWVDVPHVLALFAPYVPEANAALARVAGFIGGLWEERPPQA
ncbi:MAG: hypothetical protein CSA74_04070 [Rhodobacterales bacterium]|nr:MAG: hypothetical protein CSA74_04070 [Rhodobacterales bacterium]